MSDTVGVRRQVNCMVCSTTFTYEAYLSKAYSISNDSIKATAIATGRFNGSKGIMVDLLIHVQCPSCGVINQFKDSIDKK